MGSLSIQKGKRAERDVARTLNEVVVAVCARMGIEPFKVLRNLKQVQSGGFDLDGIAWLAIEIKHHKQVSLGSWWAQTLRQAVDGREPILIWKQHGGKWEVRMQARLRINPGSDTGSALVSGPPCGQKPRWLRVTADITFADFLTWFEKRLEVELTAKGEDALTVGDAQNDATATTGEKSALAPS